jgi:hypothetical protein
MAAGTTPVGMDKDAGGSSATPTRFPRRLHEYPTRNSSLRLMWTTRKGRARARRPVHVMDASGAVLQGDTAAEPEGRDLRLLSVTQTVAGGCAGWAGWACFCIS